MSKKKKRFNKNANKGTDNNKLRKGAPNNIQQPRTKSAEQSRYDDLIEQFHFFDEKRKPKEPIWKYGDDRYSIKMKDKAENGKDDDWGADAFVPWDHGLILTAASDINSSNTGVYYIPRNEDSRYKAEIFNVGYKATMGDSRAGSAMGLFDQRLSAFIRGTGLAWDKRHYEKRKQTFLKDYDPSTGEGNKMTQVRIYDYLVYQYLDNYNFWPNPMYDSIEKMQNCYVKMRYSVQEAKNLFGELPNFKKVKTGRWLNPDSESATEKKKNAYEDKFYDFLFYWDQFADEFVVLGDGAALIDDVIPEFHKSIPITVARWIRIPGEFWGLGVPHQIKPQIYELETGRNVRMDTSIMKASNMYEVAEAANVNEEDLRPRPSGMIKVPEVGKYIKPLEVADNDLTSYKDEEIIKDDIKRITGISDTLVGVQNGKTATETSLLKEAALKRLELYLFTEQQETLKRQGWLRMWNMKQYFSTPEAVDTIMGPKNTEKLVMKARQIRLENQQLITVTSGKKVVDAKFAKVAGWTFFNVTDEMLDADLDVDVNVSAIIPISQSMMQSRMKDVYQLLIQDPTVDHEKLNQLLFEAYDLPAEELMNMDQANQQQQQTQMNAAQGGTPPPQGDPNAQAAGGVPPQGDPNAQGAPGGGMTMDQLDPEAVKHMLELLKGHEIQPDPNPTIEHIKSQMFIYKLPQVQQRLQADPNLDKLVQMHMVYEMEKFKDNNGGSVAGGGAAAAGANPNLPTSPAVPLKNNAPQMTDVMPDKNVGYVAA